MGNFKRKLRTQLNVFVNNVLSYKHKKKLRSFGEWGGDIHHEYLFSVIAKFVVKQRKKKNTVRSDFTQL